jgi:hypothetical protein
MGSQRHSPWYDPSQVFADTRRVDLFNDPPWETPPPSGHTSVLERHSASRWASVKTALRGSVMKRGQHSHKIA